MAKHAHTTETKFSSPLGTGGAFPERRPFGFGLPLGGVGTIEVINLNEHADGDLLRACARMMALQGRWDEPGATLDIGLCREYWATAEAIAMVVPKTADGLRMKAMVGIDVAGLGGQLAVGRGTAALGPWTIAAAILRDVTVGGRA